MAGRSAAWRGGALFLRVFFFDLYGPEVEGVIFLHFFPFFLGWLASLFLSF